MLLWFSWIWRSCGWDRPVTILAFGCCYVHFCFNVVVTVIEYLMSLVNVIVIVAGLLMLDCLYTNTKFHKCKYKSNRCCKMHDWCYTTTSCMFLQVCHHLFCFWIWYAICFVILKYNSRNPLFTFCKIHLVNLITCPFQQIILDWY